MNIAVFVDGANLRYTERDLLGWRIDLRKLLDWVRRSGTVTDAIYYTGLALAPDDRFAAFVRALPHMGFSLVTKPVKTLIKRNGTLINKANLDVEIVVDMCTMLDSFDMAVLVSGDGDFRRPLELLRTRGKRFLVISTQGCVARELREVAGRHFVDLQDIRSCVEQVTAESTLARAS